MKDKLKQIMNEAMTQIDSSDKLEKLNEIKVSFLGKKGELTSILKSMKDVAPEDRPKVGQMVNDARSKIEEHLEEKKKAFEQAPRGEDEGGDNRCNASGAAHSGGTSSSEYQDLRGSREYFRRHGLRGCRGTGD